MLKNNWQFLVGLILTFFLLWPLVKAPYFTHHDDVQVIRLFEMDKCIKDWQIPCRWVPDLGGLYGYPLFNYYGPLPYYVGEIFNLLTKNLIVSAKMMFALSFIGSYIFMFLAGNKLWGKTGGALSGIFYSYIPYHAVDFYVRGAMGEMWALMLFPAIFWAIYRLWKEIKVKNILLIAGFYAFLILSHNLSAMVFTPFIAIFTLILWLKSKNFRFLKFALISFALGISLSAFYWLPALAEKNLVHLDTTTMGYFSYTEHFKGFRKLFLERSWGWGASIREVPGGEKDGMSFQIGWAHVLAWLVSIVVSMFMLKERKTRIAGILVLTFTILASISIFMVNPRSEFIWKLIAPLKYMQFPWRFLMFVAFFVCLSIGSLFLYLKGRVGNIFFIALTIFVVALNFSYFRPEKFLYITQSDLLTGNLWDRQIKRSIFDYLPTYATLPPAGLADKRYEILKGTANVTDFKEGSDWFKFSIKAKSSSVIRVSQYYFPGWKILVNGKNWDIDYDNYLGLMTINLPVGEYKINGSLHDTPVRMLGNIITFISLTGIAGYFLVKKTKADRT